LFSLKGRIFN